MQESRAMVRRVLIGIATLLLAGRAHATVYSWRDGDGAYHFTNQTADVPPGQLEAFHSFSEAAPAPSEGDGAGDPPAAADDPPGSYAQGVEAGLRMGEEQIRLAAELARVIADSAPPAAPAPIVYAPPAPAVVVDVVPAYASNCGPWNQCGYGYGYGFGYPYDSWIVGPAFFGRPFFRHGRFLHGGHRSGDRSFPFAGGGGPVGVGGHFGGHFGGRFGGGFAGRR
jgi:hypothetical protein